MVASRLFGVVAVLGVLLCGTPGHADPMDRATLAEMYKVELGERFRPEQADKLYDAHGLLESYFATTDRAARTDAVKKLESLGLAADVIGRIARIRMHWPALESGVYYINEKVGPHQVMYFLGVPPKYDRTRSWPLVVKLPTAEPFVTDPPPDGNRVAEIYNKWMSDELKANPDALLVMPRLNLSEFWGPSQAGMNCAFQPILHAAGRVNIDSTRIYLQGHSMSAHAAWNLALHYTTYFASVNPLAGGARADWQRLRSMNLANLPMVVWHDADDKQVPVDEARQLVRILKHFKCPVEYEETKGIGHAPSAELAQKMYRRMREYRRDLYPAQVNIQSNRPESLFNRIDWVQVYGPVRTGQERRFRFHHGSGMMTVYEYTFTLKAQREGNRVDLSADNVDTMRLYFNDRMVDLSKPVKVTLGNRVLFDGMLRPSVDEMLKDQTFLGRGFRCFSAILDLEIGGARATTTSRPATTRRGVIEVFPPEGSDEPPKRIELK